MQMSKQRCDMIVVLHINNIICYYKINLTQFSVKIKKQQNVQLTNKKSSHTITYKLSIVTIN